MTNANEKMIDAIPWSRITPLIYSLNYLSDNGLDINNTGVRKKNYQNLKIKITQKRFLTLPKT